jgi:hypothetical protein
MLKCLLTTQSGRSYQMLKRQLSSESGHSAIYIELVLCDRSGKILFDFACVHA